MIKNRHLHIISFDIPYPANYGGVIDVFYKIKQLKEQSIKIHLHCFEYGREHSPILNDLCETVHYYPRQTSLRSHFSLWPYIVKSRLSEALIQNLLKDDYPILFEGMHTLGVGLDKRLKQRKKIYRESNIEHQYYYHLHKAEKNSLRKIFFKIESWKLQLFERNIRYFDQILVVSQSDLKVLKQRYPQENISYIPSFHANNTVSVLEGKGKYALYVGNLSVAENIKAVLFLINNVFSKIDYPLIVAGLNPDRRLQESISHYNNIQLQANLSDAQIEHLVQNAQFNILVTFQATGLKLKLLTALFKGRFVIANENMLEGTNLQNHCIIANTAQGIVKAISQFQDETLSLEEIKERKEDLENRFGNTQNTNTLLKIMNTIYNR